MKVSVVIPAFNREYILGKAIESVLRQTHSSFEIVVVDDGSTDNTETLVRSFVDPRIRFIHHEKNRGVAAARNTGIRSAQGDLIAFLDSDDLWTPEKLAWDARFLAQNPQAEAVFCDLEYQGETPTASVIKICPAFLEFARGANAVDGVIVPLRIMYLCMLREMPIKIQATTFRQAALRAIRLFNEDWRSGEDWELLLRFVRSHNIGFIDRCLVIQRAQADSTFWRYRKVDALFLAKMFIQEKKATARHDAEAIAATKKSITRHSNRAGYLCREENELFESACAYLRGFREGGDFRLLARAVNLAFPRQLRQQIINLWNSFEKRRLDAEQVGASK